MKPLRIAAAALFFVFCHSQTSFAVVCLPGPAGTRMIEPGGAFEFVAAVDFNRDGRSDLVVVESGSGDIVILSGNGDGSFATGERYRTGTDAVFVAASDLNLDDKVDLAVAQRDGVWVLLGRGDGTFESAVRHTAGISPASIAIGDFTGDGKPDLVVANSGATNISLLVGTGAGTFQTGETFGVRVTPVCVVADDFNTDGRLDVAVANNGSGSVSILLGKGDGTFQTGSTLVVGAGPHSIVTGDFNQDGKRDLAVAYQIGVRTLFGRGDGSFQPDTFYRVGMLLTSLAIGDFNADGKADLVASGGSFFGNAFAFVFLGNGDGTFQSVVNYAAGETPVAVALSDFNGDGRSDLVLANRGSPDSSPPSSGNISVIFGNGDGTFQDSANYAAEGLPSFVTAGEFNGDGRLDLVVTATGAFDPIRQNFTNGGVLLFVGIGDGTFMAPIKDTAEPSPTSAAAGDYNRDGRDDLAVLNLGSMAVSLLMARGDGTFQKTTNYNLGGNARSILTSDFNGDREADLAVAVINSGVSILLGKGDGTFGAPRTFGPPLAEYLAVGDLNRDGKMDLAVAATRPPAGDTCWVLLGGGDGTFEEYISCDAGPLPGSLSIADLNGDLEPDLIAVNVGWIDPFTGEIFPGGVSVLLGTGDGTFPNRITLETVAFPSATVAGKLNGDDIADLVVTTERRRVSVLLGRGDGTFEIPLNYVTGPGSGYPTLADLDGNGRLDLAVANSISPTGTVSVLLDRCALTLPTLSVARPGGNIIISWPDTATGFGLEWAPHLGITNWQAEAGIPTNHNNQLQFTVPAGRSEGYYRLRKQ